MSFTVSTSTSSSGFVHDQKAHRIEKLDATSSTSNKGWLLACGVALGIASVVCACLLFKQKGGGARKVSHFDFDGICEVPERSSC